MSEKKCKKIHNVIEKLEGMITNETSKNIIRRIVYLLVDILYILLCIKEGKE